MNGFLLWILVERIREAEVKHKVLHGPTVKHKLSWSMLQRENRAAVV